MSISVLLVLRNKISLICSETLVWSTFNWKCQRKSASYDVITYDSQLNCVCLNQSSISEIVLSDDTYHFSQQIIRLRSNCTWSFVHLEPLSPQCQNTTCFQGVTNLPSACRGMRHCDTYMSEFLLMDIGLFL